MLHARSLWQLLACCSWSYFFSPLWFRNDILKKRSKYSVREDREVLDTSLSAVREHISHTPHRPNWYFEKGQHLATFTNCSKYHMREAYGISLPAADKGTFSHPSHSKCKFSVRVLSSNWLSYWEKRYAGSSDLHDASIFTVLNFKSWQILVMDFFFLCSLCGRLQVSL